MLHFFRGKSLDVFSFPPGGRGRRADLGPPLRGGVSGRSARPGPGQSAAAARAKPKRRHFGGQHGLGSNTAWGQLPEFMNFKLFGFGPF